MEQKRGEGTQKIKKMGGKLGQAVGALKMEGGGGGGGGGAGTLLRCVNKKVVDIILNFFLLLNIGVSDKKMNKFK